MEMTDLGELVLRDQGMSSELGGVTREWTKQIGKLRVHRVAGGRTVRCTGKVTGVREEMMGMEGIGQCRVR